MDLNDFDFTLRWPTELFSWEARRILTLKSSNQFTNMVVCLFTEAFVDVDIADQIAIPISRNVFDPGRSRPSPAVEVLTGLLADQSVLHEYEPPLYWLERQGGATSTSLQKPLSKAFLDLVDEMRELDYFPRILPKGCVDDGMSWRELIDDASAEMSKAIRSDVVWPLEATIPNEVLYSVIEYLHDQAQRPRTRSFHSYNECGWHYADHNKESGGVVFRWRVNELLDRYGVSLRLGSKGTEKGRLVRHATLQLDELAQELADASGATDDGKVASAIRLYRSRASTVHDRRSAIAQLAGRLEKQRASFKASEFAKGDEDALFNIFNNFAIRHDNARQNDNYGDEYLDWIFWTTLAAVQLMNDLGKRTVNEQQERTASRLTNETF